MSQHATDMPVIRRHTVEEAARVLGISENAVRKRVERNSLRSVRVDDTRYVLLESGMPRYADDMPNGMPTDQPLITGRLESEIEFLRELVRTRDEELRREREAREEAEQQRQADEEAKQEQEQPGAALEQLADATRQSFQAMADRTVSLQESNLKLTQNFFQNWIQTLQSQTEGNRHRPRHKVRALPMFR